MALEHIYVHLTARAHSDFAFCNGFLDARVKISRKLTASDSGLMGEANKLFAQVNFSVFLGFTRPRIR